MDKLVVGCGYLGRRVAAQWLANGHHVWATTRTEQHAAELRRLGVNPVLCNVLDSRSLREIPPVETVVYCIGHDRSSGATMRRVYGEGLANYLCDAVPAQRMLYVSSTSVYGQTAGELVDESAATDPQEPSGQVVLEAERILRKVRPDAIILRFAGIYGPGRLLRGESIRKGEPMVGDPEKWLNLIHIDDGVRAVVAAEMHGLRGDVCIVSDDSPVKRWDFYRELARLLHAPEPSWQVPAANMALPPHERANRRLTNQRMRREFQVELQYPTYHEGLPAAVAEERGS